MRAAIIATIFSVSNIVFAENLGSLDNSASPANPLSGDFLTGFESGIFLRQSESEYAEYNCP